MNSTEARFPEALKKTILICGCGRSGTSILGRLVSSHKNIEYSFDSPLMHWLFGFLDQVDLNVWKKFASVYLYREVFLNALHGRNLNFNVNDLSCVYTYKDKKEIENRLRSMLSKTEIRLIESMHHLCFKVTDAVFHLKTVKAVFPEWRITAICRNAEDTVRSILNQGWFSDEFMKQSSLFETLPRKISGQHLLPTWIDEAEVDYWNGLSSIEKAAFYYLKANKSLLANMNIAVVVNYDWMVLNAFECVARIQKKHELIPVEKTNEVCESIKPRASSAHPDVLTSCRISLRDEIEAVNTQISKITFSEPSER